MRGKTRRNGAGLLGVRRDVRPTVELRRGADRFRTQHPLVETWHSFSAGRHYDPANTSFGRLVLHDEHVLQAGGGFDPHLHRDLEVVTWVLEGRLAHEDDAGRRAVVGPGSVQLMSAGRGVVHAERSAGAGGVRFVQAWVVPDERGAEPRYDQRTVDLPAGALVAVASGLGHDDAVVLGTPTAALHVARLVAGQSVALPDAPYLHVFVPRGAAAVDGQQLGEGDALRATHAGGQRLTATAGCELMVWELHAPL